MTFYSCENAVLRKHVKHNLISYKAFIKYMECLTTIVQNKIQVLLPDKFDLVFGSYRVSEVHYIAVYATIPTKIEVGHRKFLTI